MTIPFTNDASKQLKKGFTGKGSGWAALSCVPGYRISPSNITYTVDPQTQRAESHDYILFEEGENIGLDEERLSEPLERNTLSNGLVYNLSSPVFRRTFWNAPSPNAFITRKDLFAKWYENFDVEGCQSVSTESNIWTNENACQMYANVATLWPVVVAGTVSVSALYVPDEIQQSETGKVVSYRKGWYLTGFELIATILLHTAVLLLLKWQHILHWDKGVPGFVKSRSKNGLRSRYKTGLYGTASSIAGRAFVFQDKSLQPLFEGLDAMKPSKAIAKSESRFAETKLLLRKWRLGADGDDDSSEHETTFAKIRPAKDIKGYLEDPKKEPKLASLMVKRIWKYLKNLKCIRKVKRNLIRRNTADQAARRLRYGQTPTVLRPILLVFIFSSTVTIIAIVIQYVLLSKNDGFQMWFQPTYPLSRTSSHEIRRYIQKALFKGLPAFILIGLGYWWEAVERYYRTTEPYVALSRGATGKMSVCLDYVHSMHIVTAFKALMNSHFLLFYVTYTTVAVKMCIILASGIFSMDEIGSLPGRDFPLTRDWRTNNFPDEVEAEFVPSLRTFAMSRAVFGYPQTAGWQSASQDGRAWVFPSVEPDGRQFQMNLTGISSSLECKIANTTFNVVDGAVTATIQDKTCSNATWANICSSPSAQSSNADPRSPRASCMLWRYVEDSSCQSTPTSVKGRWWIVSLNGTSTAPSSNSSNIISSVSSSISLLCEPRIWNMTASLTTTQKSDGFWITTWNGDNIKQMSSERWSGTKNTSLNFDAFSSRILNDTFTGELFRTSDDGWLDRFSIMSKLGSKQGSSAFFKNASAVSEAASMTYSRAFAALISQNLQTNQTSGNSSLLLEWVAPTTGDKPRSTVHALPFANMATVDRGALYAAILILGMYAIAIFFVWPRRRRRMPLDIAYTANAMSMVYDSQMLEIIRQSKECKDFKCLQNTRFAIGCYEGLSSRKPRLGIDVQDRVREITQHTLPFFHSRAHKEHNDVTAGE